MPRGQPALHLQRHRQHEPLPLTCLQQEQPTAAGVNRDLLPPFSKVVAGTETKLYDPDKEELDKIFNAQQHAANTVETVSERLLTHIVLYALTPEAKQGCSKLDHRQFVHPRRDGCMLLRTDFGLKDKYSAVKRRNGSYVYMQLGRNARKQRILVGVHRLVVACLEGLTRRVRGKHGGRIYAVHKYSCPQHCVNPLHLRSGTASENREDVVRLMKEQRRPVRKCKGW